MLASDKIIVGLVVMGAFWIAALVESAYPGFLACFGAAFVVGAIAAEVVRARRRRTIRSMVR
jgi:hypothetical protein